MNIICINRTSCTCNSCCSCQCCSYSFWIWSYCFPIFWSLGFCPHLCFKSCWRLGCWDPQDGAFRWRSGQGRGLFVCYSRPFSSCALCKSSSYMFCVCATFCLMFSDRSSSSLISLAASNLFIKFIALNCYYEM